jgi:hypothetical protein
MCAANNTIGTFAVGSAPVRVKLIERFLGLTLATNLCVTRHPQSSFQTLQMI